MRQIEIDSFNRRVFGNDHAEHGPSAASDIDHCREALEAHVRFQYLLHGNGGVIGHSPVEDLVESWVGAVILKRGHPIRLVERDSAFKDRIFQVIPTS